MLYRIVLITCATSFLTACAMFQGTKQNDHDAICNQLKHKIIWSGATGRGPELWNGATGRPMQSTQQRAENETLMRNYEEEGCDRGYVDGGT